MPSRDGLVGAVGDSLRTHMGVRSTPGQLGSVAEDILNALHPLLRTAEQMDAEPHRSILLDAEDKVYLIGDFDPVGLGYTPSKEPPELPARVWREPRNYGIELEK